MLPADLPALKMKLYERAQESDGCWLWTGVLNEGGYGQFSWKGKTWRVHRLAYRVFVGDFDDSLAIDHLCSNRSCINPAHLDAVTHLENNRRSSAVEVNRNRSAQATHCKNGHEYTQQNTALTRRANGRHHRVCITCRRAKDVRQYSKHHEDYLARKREAYRRKKSGGFTMPKDTTYGILHNRLGDAVSIGVMRSCAKAIDDMKQNIEDQRESEKDLALAWLLSDDTGVSSETLCAHMLGMQKNWQSPPSDAADRASCVRLLNLIPSWWARLDELSVSEPGRPYSVNGDSEHEDDWKHQIPMIRHEAALTNPQEEAGVRCERYPSCHNMVEGNGWGLGHNYCSLECKRKDDEWN